jgi:serine protease
MSVPPPAVDEPGREVDAGNPNGFLIVVLEPGLGRLDTDDLREVAKEADLTDLAAELDRLDVRSAVRLIAPDELDNLRRLEERARRRNPRRISRGLDRFWRLDVRHRSGRAGLPDLARGLAVLAGVDTAYAEATVADPGAVPDPDPADPGAGAGTLAAGSMSQGYLDAAPHGVDARWAWSQPGGRGTGVSVVDIEQGWRVKHPALLRWDPLVLPHPRRINRDGFRAFVGAHGTSVVGVLAADGTPAVGVAPGVASVRACSHYDGIERTGLHVAAAILQATAAVPDEGSVVLLEVQRERSDKRPVPTETDLADFEAIVLAVDAGYVVVEAAGNGNVDIDLWESPTGRRMVRDHDHWDSGAIMVGAAESELTDGDGHARWVRTATDGSNFGARVDCHAWGEKVATATATSTSGVGYRPDFNGTSSASAIVAGAAACAQGMAVAAGHLYDSPGLRADFRATGTPQRPVSAAEKIGTMPDLRAITP